MRDITRIPSPAEIRRACQAVREGWTAAERRRRDVRGHAATLWLSRLVQKPVYAPVPVRRLES